jgi:hypothetical protein
MPPGPAAGTKSDSTDWIKRGAPWGTGRDLSDKSHWSSSVRILSVEIIRLCDALSSFGAYKFVFNLPADITFHNPGLLIKLAVLYEGEKRGTFRAWPGLGNIGGIPFNQAVEPVPSDSVGEDAKALKVMGRPSSRLVVRSSDAW